MKENELLGYKLEIVGLFLALLAAFWQANFSGWWDIERTEWQYLIQEEANFAILSALGDIAELQAKDELTQKDQHAFNIKQSTVEAKSRAIDMRQQRKERLDEQAELFSIIGFSLMFISATLIILGKILIYNSAKKYHDSLKQPPS